MQVADPHTWEAHSGPNIGRRDEWHKYVFLMRTPDAIFDSYGIFVTDNAEEAKKKAEWALTKTKWPNSVVMSKVYVPNEEQAAKIKAEEGIIYANIS